MKNYFKFISKLFQIILILTIPNFLVYGQQQPCPKEINNPHNQNAANEHATIYVYNASGKIIGQGECSINGGGQANCNNVLNNLNRFLPEVAEYLSFVDITKEEDLGSCLYNKSGKKIDPFLPVELLYFKPVVKDGTVVLNWSTGSETNNDYFTIERSLDGYNWVSILSIRGQGNSTKKSVYELYDRVFGLSGIVYYRLSQTDYDGKREVFDIKSCFIHKRKVVKIVNTLGHEVDINYKGLKIVIYDNGERVKYI